MDLIRVIAIGKDARSVVSDILEGTAWTVNTVNSSSIGNFNTYTYELYLPIESIIDSRRELIRKLKTVGRFKVLMEIDNWSDIYVIKVNSREIYTL